MDSNRGTLEELFHRALAASSIEERAALLALAGPAERARVEALIASHQAAAGFFKIAGDAPSTCECPGSQIGPYRLIREIGEGGFAVVFAAQQTDPVQRTVALKVIKLGMNSRQVMARFSAERQTLGLMEHPHIAKVYDAGTTQTGRPYFVMELVPDGKAITTYCDEHRLSIPQRLDLFADVCAAVQHAHQKGIIHRDVKPSNVLVTVIDGRPVVKVIDFGIAKATTPTHHGQTLFTEAGQLIGTLEYMSPEQAEGHAAQVDTRSDIYSLGALLYELMVGSTPFEARALREKALAEVQRVIREVDPARPSTRLTQSPQAITDVAAVRRVEPQRLTRLLRGDLDWVIMKCLEKDPGRRYESAAALAADVGRYLRQEPVAARPPGGGYWLRKLLRRHRLPFGAGAVVAATVVLALIVSLRLLLREREALSRAVGAQRMAEDAKAKEAAQRLRAENHLGRAREIAQLVRILAGGESRQSVQANALRQEVLEKIARNLEVLTADSADDAASTAELAEAYYNATLARRELNQWDEAAKLCRAAIGHLRAAAERRPDELRYRQRLADYCFALSEIAREQSNGAEQTRALEEALAQERLSYQSNPDDLGDASHYAWLLTMVARNFMERGRTDEAVGLAGQGTSLQEQLLARSPADPSRVIGASDAHLEYAVSLQQAGRYEDSLVQFRRGNELDRQHLASRKKDVRAADRLARGLEASVHPLVSLGRADQAEAALAEAYEVARQGLAVSPENLDLHLRMLFYHRAIGYLRWLQGGHREAAAAYAAARGECDWLIDAAPYDPDLRRQCVALLVEAVEPSGRDLQRAIQLARQSLQRLPRDGRMLALLADALYQAGDVPGAYEAMMRADASDYPPNGGSLYLRAILQHAAGHVDAARETFKRAQTAPTRPPSWDSVHVEAACRLFEKSEER